MDFTVTYLGSTVNWEFCTEDWTNTLFTEGPTTERIYTRGNTEVGYLSL